MTFEDKTIEFIDCIIKKTREYRLIWEPINFFLDNTENDEIISLIRDTNMQLIENDSFYTERHESLLFISHYKSFDDTDKYVMIGSASAYASPFNIPDVFGEPYRRFEEICMLAREQYNYLLNEDGFPEPVYYFYRNMMSND